VLLVIVKSGSATSRVTTTHANDAVAANNEVVLIVRIVVLTAQA
jgi:hypothetical protein